MRLLLWSWPIPTMALLVMMGSPAPANAAPGPNAASRPDSRAVHTLYDREAAAQVVPLLSAVIRFPTFAGNDQARLDQQAWLRKTGAQLGLRVTDAGPVTEIELAGPAGAPVLGLLVHGDVQPVEASGWTIPPFEGAVRDGHVLGRGAADDKGPLVLALLAMKVLRDSGLPRTHTIRLLVGSDEESGSKDIPKYLESHAPPAYSLVLDSAFPVVVGEKGWDALHLTTTLGARPGGPARDFEVVALEGGLSPSIVPDRAQITLRWAAREPRWAALRARLMRVRLPPDTRLELKEDGAQLTVTAHGRAAHGGVNIEGGRNALVALARAFAGLLPAGGADDLLGAARLAGKDIYGTGFGLTARHPLWGRYAVNVATLKRHQGAHRLLINLRRPPPLTAPQLKAHLTTWTASYNRRTGAQLQVDGYFQDEPLVFDPQAKLVKRLMAAYQRQTGRRAPPAISGGGTYAKRMPSSIAFGMWFPGKPYPGHDVDEKMPIADLHRGAHVLLEALVDLACTPPLDQPFRP